jgi:hypothetical protein
MVSLGHGVCFDVWTAASQFHEVCFFSRFNQLIPALFALRCKQAMKEWIMEATGESAM